MIKHSKLAKNINTFDHVEFTNDIEGLCKIISKEKTLVIYQRTVSEKMLNFISKIDLEHFPSIHTSFYSYESKATLQALLNNYSEDIEGLNLFINDLAKIIEIFSVIVRIELVRINLQVIQDDMCKYFHSDYNNLRLICTYAGAGTYWTVNENVNREKLGSRCNEEIVKDPKRIHQMERFWVAIFKGEVFMNNAGNGIVHCSPKISMTGEKRILLRIDI